MGPVVKGRDLIVLPAVNTFNCKGEYRKSSGSPSEMVGSGRAPSCKYI